ncbi:MAG: OmpA family protein [Bacteroidia bacterium]|nr:OmpA family protein [Bacteroidia bacterium]
MKYTYSILLCLIGLLVNAQQFTPHYKLVKLDKTVNTFYHEAAPVVSPDGKDLYFFIQNHPENTYGKEGSQDIWITHKDDQGTWSPANRLGSPLNNSRSNQVFNVLPDGSVFIRGAKGKNKDGFSIVSKDGGTTELDVIDFDKMKKGRFYGATISAGIKHMILYFSEFEKSARSDLYISHVQPDGRFSRPVKMKITNNSDEFGPFLAPDNKTLYFASDRSAPNKQGGADIYRSERLDETWENWSEPINLGRPVNTAAGDFYFSVDAAGDVFTSRANSRVDGGNLDLFVLVLSDIKVMLAGVVYNEKTREPVSSSVILSIAEQKPVSMKAGNDGKFETQLPDTKQYIIAASSEGFLAKEETFSVPKIDVDTTLTVEIYLTTISKKQILKGTVFDQKTEKPVTSKLNVTIKPDRKSNLSIPAEGGKYEQEISRTGWYVMTASASGYLNSTDSVEIISDVEAPFIKDFYLQPIEVGLTVRLKNIYFDFDKTTLKSESFVELNKVVDFLKQNSSVEIEIAGHTDSKGADTYNETLSQGRSQSVVDYLVGQGIAESRLSAHGYGEAKPIETNDTEEGRANNRRVEFTVLKK